MTRQDPGQFARAATAGRPGAGRVRVADMADLAEVRDLACDVLIVGGGPAGLTVARGLDGAKLDILILESGGLAEGPDAEALNEVIATPDTWTATQQAQRQAYHAALTRHWDAARQGFGVRCRGLGGSTAAWAGKSAAFDEIDYARRDWVPNSGWPLQPAELTGALDRAARLLNLGPNVYDDRLWELMQRPCPEPRPDPEVLRSYFWQFARSTIDPMDILRAGHEFLKDEPVPCRILTGATVTEIVTDPDGGRAAGAVVADAHGTRRRVSARTVVLAASAIENARLLLASTRHHPNGLGNGHDTVGRYLLDHPCAEVARFDAPAIARMSELFGFFGLGGAGGMTMYMRGLAPRPEVQAAEGLLNCAAFMPGERAPDDPWEAAKRILGRQSDSYLSDGVSILRSPGLVAKGLGRLALQHRRMPRGLARFAVNQVIRFRPKMAAEEYLTGGLPHKLTGLDVQAICEQVPDPENRVTLAGRTDRFGTPLPRVRWRVGETEMRTLAHFARLLRDGFARSGMPAPILSDWVAEERLGDAAVIDMAHTAGTTRMSDDPQSGVVDRDCQVHGVHGLFVAGGSVFPTNGHVNSTLMITALAVRLGDHIAARATSR
ncbi:GMC family oxidoreductase [Psychromarinibacter sp. C21-152]|uniref:GMC family oxidoreductase n=1 Tax=Psychromarinibacter sediminicola TaxID=3033385 RepID=A0AAE3T9R8_9RHOB|nr:GMC family oxidoreductase [Psychromarinibacter sediminicola]MDF0602093.1 GMC family oxidoreductase [Psychromarinibacter sediminicola]